MRGREAEVLYSGTRWIGDGEVAVEVVRRDPRTGQETREPLAHPEGKEAWYGWETTDGGARELAEAILAHAAGEEYERYAAEFAGTVVVHLEHEPDGWRPSHASFYPPVEPAEGIVWGGPERVEQWLLPAGRVRQWALEWARPGIYTIDSLGWPLPCAEWVLRGTSRKLIP